MTAFSEEKIDIANIVLRSFAEKTHIECRDNKLYVCWEIGGVQYGKLWRCRPNQDIYPIWYNQWAHGGTACTALSQLIRWIKNEPVLPLTTWEYWASDKVKLLDPMSLDYLRNNGYPQKVNCVLCDNEIKRGIDWWHLKGVSGPCCSMRTGCCQKGKS